MAIDPSIPLSVRAPQIESSADVIGRAMTLRQMAQQGRIRDLQERMTLREMADAQAVRAALTRTGGNVRKALPEINRVDPKLGAELAKALTDSERASIELFRTRLDTDLKSAEFISQILGGVKDQQTYTMALGAIKGAGLPTEQMPPTFEKGYVDGLIQKGLSIKERLEQARAETDDKLKGEQQTETKRHNEAVEEREEYKAWLSQYEHTQKQSGEIDPLTGKEVVKPYKMPPTFAYWKKYIKSGTEPALAIDRPATAPTAAENLARVEAEGAAPQGAAPATTVSGEVPPGLPPGYTTVPPAPAVAPMRTLRDLAQPAPAEPRNVSMGRPIAKGGSLEASFVPGSARVTPAPVAAPPAPTPAPAPAPAKAPARAPVATRGTGDRPPPVSPKRTAPDLGTLTAQAATLLEQYRAEQDPKKKAALGAELRRLRDALVTARGAAAPPSGGGGR